MLLHAGRSSSLGDMLRDGVKHGEDDTGLLASVNIPRHLIEENDQLDPLQRAAWLYRMEYGLSCGLERLDLFEWPAKLCSEDCVSKC